MFQLTRRPELDTRIEIGTHLTPCKEDNMSHNSQASSGKALDLSNAKRILAALQNALGSRADSVYLGVADRDISIAALHTPVGHGAKGKASYGLASGSGSGGRTNYRI